MRSIWAPVAAKAGTAMELAVRRFRRSVHVAEPANAMERPLPQHQDGSIPDIRAHSTAANRPGCPYKILYILREARILDWSFAARGPRLPARRATHGRLSTRTRPVREGARGLAAHDRGRSWRMRDSNSRRGRASRSVRRHVSRSSVRAPRVRKKSAKDAETQPGNSPSAMARPHRLSRKSRRVTGIPPGDDARVTPSSGNVFLDIGFSPGEAEHLAVRSHLMMAIEQLIRERGLTQTRAARLFGVTQPRVSDLVRGRIELFSIDALVEMLGRAGFGLSIRLEPRRRPA